jgi:hypothetical protein
MTPKRTSWLPHSQFLRVLGLASPSAELCWRQDLTAEANCLFLDSTCQRVIRNDTRRQRQSQLSKSRSDADQRVGKPSVHVGTGPSTDDGFCRDSWEWEACVEERLATALNR